MYLYIEPKSHFVTSLAPKVIDLLNEKKYMDIFFFSRYTFQEE